jgi:hypothetical protein
MKEQIIYGTDDRGFRYYYNKVTREFMYFHRWHKGWILPKHKTDNQKSPATN